MSDASLIGVGIRQGDVLPMRRSKGFKDGDLVTADTPDGLFVVFIYAELGGKLRLVGAHPECPVRRYLPKDVQILGVYDATRKGGE
jgi:SOS-response transcriptional repressor LexA